MASKRFRASSLGLLMMGVVALSLTACTSTMKDCATGFTVISPKDGSTLQPGDVKVEWTAIPSTFCTFAPHTYEASLNGAPPVVVPGDAAPTTTFKNLGPGEYTVVVTARDAASKSVAQCAAKFRIPAPPPPAAPAVVAPPPAPPAPGVDLVQEAMKYLKDAFFDYDKSEIRADQKDAVAADAQWLRGHTTVGVTIEGHCDERGTREYNLALGERRANAVRDALVALGVDPAQIKTISYGKERPFCTEHPKEKDAQEACWQSNRRGHFVPALR